jgi:hypothetical protein
MGRKVDRGEEKDRIGPTKARCSGGIAMGLEADASGEPLPCLFRF